MPKVEGIIKIQVALRKEGSATFLQFDVIDNGPGISDDDQKRLFKPFSKLEAHQDLNPNGNGLGLHICNLICRNLGGDITVESTHETSTKFRFKVQV